jgi:hypothetical protein
MKWIIVNLNDCHDVITSEDNRWLPVEPNEVDTSLDGRSGTSRTEQVPETDSFA